SRRRHTRWPRDWSSDVCSSDLSRPASKSELPDLRPSHGSFMWLLEEPIPMGRCALFPTRVRVSSFRLPGISAMRPEYPEVSVGKIGRASCRERVEVWVGGV